MCFCHSRWQVSANTRLMFGIANGPSVFQRIMTNVTSRLGPSIVTPYIDDALISGENFREMLNNLDLTLSALEDASAYPNVKFLAYLGKIAFKLASSCQPISFSRMLIIVIC